MEQTIGKRIAAHRKDLGLTQDQLAEKLGVTPQAVSKWENDQSCPDITTLPLLAEIFHTSTDALLGRVSEEVAHEAEIIEDDTIVNGLHIDDGRLEFHWDNGKKDAIGLGVFVILVGVLNLARSLFLNISFWDTLWPSALLIFGLWGLFPKFSVFRLGCMLAGGFFLCDKIFSLNINTGNSLFFPAVIILFGISLLTDALRKNKKNFINLNYSDGKNKKNQKSQNRFEIDETSFVYHSSFGENTQYVTLQGLSAGDISTCFGDYTIDLSGVTSVYDDCRIEASCSFGELKILVPRRFAVQPVSSTSFAAFDIIGHPNPETDGKISLDANVSFGQIEVQYI